MPGRHDEPKTSLDNLPFRRNDFVLMNRPKATTVGLVARIHDGKHTSIEVWWYQRTRPDGTAQIIDTMHEPEELRLATASDSIPDAMRRLQAENNR